MTLPTNGTGKRIIAGIVVGIVMLVVAALSGAVISNATRITAIEENLKNLTKVGDQTLAQIEKNRDASYKEYKEIMAELRGAKK